MPKSIDPIKYAIVKKARLEGKSKAEAMRQAGYKATTAGHCVNPKNRLLNLVDDEILADVKAHGVTVEEILAGLKREALNPDSKSADKIAAYSWLGKYLAMFTDKVKTEMTIADDRKKEIDSLLDELGIKVDESSKADGNQK